MNSLLRERLGDPSSRSEEELRQRFREAVQEIALYSLSAHGFFEKAIFHGGTELRIVHSLPRFSEDLDFPRGGGKGGRRGMERSDVPASHRPAVKIGELGLSEENSHNEVTH